MAKGENSFYNNNFKRYCQYAENLNYIDTESLLIMIPLLQFKNFSIQFSKNDISFDAVRNISFEIQKNNITAIVGESGSGKSVTAMSVLKLLPEYAKVSGNILFSEDGTTQMDIRNLEKKNINSIRGNKIGMVFQEPMTSLNPLMTCGNQVMEAIIQHKKLSKTEAKKRTIELFKKVELPNPDLIFKRYAHQISGGQKQRVMIAMAISCDPLLLIADEPTTALDVIVQKNIMALLKKLQQQNNMAVLLITHDLGLVADYADDLIVFYKGEIVESGMAVDILSNPSHAYTKGLISCRPSLGSKGKKLPVLEDFLSSTSSKIINDNSTTFESKKEIAAQPILSVENLEVLFPATKNIWGKTKTFHKALDDISFKVMQNEILGIVGESGSGKTTLGKAILQLIKPNSGNIFLKGKDITQLYAKNVQTARKELQIVFQDPYGSLNPRLTIGDAITEPMKVHNLHHNDKSRKEKAMELLKQVKLEDKHFKRYPHQFSGGQRQRICIARALALEPSFLIFDESVSALDVSVQAQILNLINELKASLNFTSIFISHDLSVVHYISDRILVMKNGKIVEDGSADTIISRPIHDYTKQLISAIPGSNIQF